MGGGGEGILWGGWGWGGGACVCVGGGGDIVYSWRIAGVVGTGQRDQGTVSGYLGENS